MSKQKETYRLEMTIFRNFNGTKEEALQELKEDMEGFDAGEYGWLSENYMPEDSYLSKLDPYEGKEEE